MYPTMSYPVKSRELSGEIPSDIGEFSSLRFLNMSKNSLTGEIPKTVGKLTALNILDLSVNKLNRSIPVEIGGATSLKDLVLSQNSGQLPEAMAKLDLFSKP
ncbi:putative non-specific serine/threonine protein kinase [Helianthus annuus]|uniref:Non-specific serine/threonine protein kinase n=1 Tax=Helianthus annuus TaxID=4232 RepID=A0A251VKE8_HELAN|nr:putative non-specific serine/threonine protein kinase [Helianthus annuus]KAJ0625470.1 putative non-specific serine/threonine protein kinase [Helianthus annuus]